MRFVDLSVPLENEGRPIPRWARNRVRYHSHRHGRWMIRLLLGLSKKYLRGGLGWATEQLNINSHGTTHVDAPWHYAPTSAGQPAATIDQVPLHRFYGPAVVLDLRHKEHGDAITPVDLEQALAEINHHLSEGDIVLLRTGGDTRLGTAEYFTQGTGLSAAATRWLLERGVFVIGIDAWGLDLPLPLMARRARQRDLRSYFWEAHYVGIARPYCQIERLTNLGALPPTGATVCCFPLKVKEGSAGPARVVAMVPEDHDGASTSREQDG